MTRETAAMKAARILLDPKRTRPVRCNLQGLAFDVIGDSADGFAPEPYRVMRWKEGGRILETCTCEGAGYHPVRPKCSHMELARLVMNITHGW